MARILLPFAIGEWREGERERERERERISVCF
jgi:hypothetical protein